MYVLFVKAKGVTILARCVVLDLPDQDGLRHLRYRPALKYGRDQAFCNVMTNRTPEFLCIKFRVEFYTDVKFTIKRIQLEVGR